MKKIISLTLVLALALSMALSVSAASGTLSLAKLTTADKLSDASNADGYYMVPLTLSGIAGYDEATGFVGYDSASMYIIYDSTKLTAGYKVGRGTVYGDNKVQMTMADCETGVATDASALTYKDNAYDATHRKLSIVMSPSGNAVLDGSVAASGIFTNIYFRPVTGATGVAEIKIEDTESFGIKGGLIVDGVKVTEHTDFTLNAGSIALSAEETKYTVTASAGANGSIAEKDGKTEGATGDVLTYNITAETGYVIDTITVDGVADTSKAGQDSATITYTVAEAAGAISVTFKAEETETTIATIGRYKDATALYTLGKVVVGTNGCTRYGVAVQSVKRGEEVYYSGSGKTDEGYYVVGFTGTAYDNNAATKAFADITDAASRIFGAEVSEYTAE